MRIWTKLPLAVSCATLIVTASGYAFAQSWSIGTNPQGSGAYVEGSAFARHLTNDLGVRTTVEPHTGATVYLPLLNSGEISMGINSNLDAGAFYQGQVGGRKATELRALFHSRPLIYAYIAPTSSGVESVEDLNGKRVITEIRGNYSLTRVNQAILATGGLETDDVDSSVVGSMGEGYEGMVENRYDAHAGAVGIAFVREVDASLSDGIRYVALGDQASDQLLDDYIPGLYTFTIDESMVDSGVDGPTQVAAFDFFLTTGTHLSTEDAKRIVKSIYEGFPEIQENNPVLRNGDRSRLAKPTNTVPYHPGAIEAFKELGLWTEANEAREAQLRN